MDILKSQIISLPQADITKYPCCFSEDESNMLFNLLKSRIKWKHKKIRVFGREIDQPRLTALYGDPNKPYSYSGITLQPEPWTAGLKFIKRKIEPIAKVRFTTVLLNLYRDGNDSVSWHSDDEAELGLNPVIGSVSFGEARKFMLKHKKDKQLKVVSRLPMEASC